MAATRITALIHDVQIHPPGGTGPNNAGEAHIFYHSPEAPWTTHGYQRGAIPGHITALLKAQGGSLQPKTLTDGAKVVTITPRITALRIMVRDDGATVLGVNVTWNDGTTDVHGTYYETLPDAGFVQAHQAFLQATQATLTASL